MLKSVLCMLLASAALQAGAEISRTGLYFEPNYGQFSFPSAFAARTSDTTVLLEPDHLRFHGASGVRSLEWIGNNRERSTWQPRCALPGVSNYYTERLRLSGVPHYSEVYMRGLYPGVAIRAYSTGNEFEFDFEVARGADPSQIRWRVPEASAHISADGSLEAGSLRLNNPRAWQMIRGRIRSVEVSFTLTATGVAGFRLGSWDRRYALTIDPIVASVAWSTLIGGGGKDTVAKVAANAAGDVWVAGSTTSLAFGGGSSLRTTEDAYVAKLTSNGTALAFVTFFGGRGVETATSLSLDAVGNAVVGGKTTSADLPVLSAFQTTYGGGDSDGFLVRIQAAGAVVWASYLGGSGPESVMSVALRPSDGAVFAVGKGSTGVSNFPTLGTSESGTETRGAFLTGLSAAGVRRFSILFGGATEATPTELIVDNDGNPIVAGTAGTRDVMIGWCFGYVRGPFAARFSPDNGSQQAFFNPTYGGNLVGLAVDSQNRIYTFSQWSLTSQISHCGSQGGSTLFQLSPDLSGVLRRWEIPALQQISLTSMVASPDASFFWFAGGSENVTALNAGSLKVPGALHTSGDYGATWTKTDLGTTVRSMVANDAFAFAATPDGLFRCPHGSSSWTLIFAGDMYAVAASSESSWVYAADAQTLYRSADDGNSFQRAGTPPGNPVRAIAFALGQPQNVLLSTAAVSSDYGSTFQQRGFWFDIAAASVTNDDIYVRTPVSYASHLERFTDGYAAKLPALTTIDAGMTLAVDPRNNDVYFARSTGPLQRSTDRGVTWSTVGTDAFLAQLAISEDGTFYRLGNSVSTSTDGRTWVPRGNAPGKELFAVAPKHSGRLYSYGRANTRDGIVLRFDTMSGETRYALPTGGGDITSLAMSNGAVYAAGTPNGIGLPGMRSTLTGTVPSVHDGTNAFVLRLQESDCSTTLSSTSVNAPATGGTGSVSVTAATCDWTATSSATWIRLTGTSSGSVTFEVQPNNGSHARSGEVLIGVSRLVVNQSGTVCTLVTTPPGTALPGVAGVGSLNVVPTPASCMWTLTSDAGWLSFPTKAITGSGSVNFRYTSNPSPLTRTATISGSGLTHRVTQQGGPCSWTLTAPTLNVGAEGGLAIAPTVPSHPACDSIASTTADWIRIETIGAQEIRTLRRSPHATNALRP